MGRGVHRGFITYEELNKSLGKRNLSSNNLEQAFIHILDEKITLVEKKSDYKVLRKKENASKDEGRSIEKSDDPIRMYLREMGGVELLSREGEIAIAKRIEAGKDVMLNALSQSPITAKQFFEWNEKLQKDEILVREIMISGLREFLAKSQISMPVTGLAKFKTFIQMFAIAILLTGESGNKLISFQDYNAHTIGIVFLWLSAFLTLYTGYDYVKKGIDHAVK